MLNRVKQETGKCLTEKKNGKAHITVYGEEIIRERLTGIKHDNEKMFNSVKHSESEEIAFLREQNKLLLDELVKERNRGREQTDKISDLATQLVELTRNITELTRNSQILLGAEQSRTNPTLNGNYFAYQNHHDVHND
jgi:molybdenum-dependent DNA-binding transcriptional regulator ModE